jgi:DNA-directed RNA polymerase subunit beta'
MADNIYDRINDYGSVKIQLASPNDIRSWSFGEVKKPETINYRTYRRRRTGCSASGSSVRSATGECACGKYKGTKYKGIICDRCGVKVTHSRVRRKRMGHINLAAPGRAHLVLQGDAFTFGQPAGDEDHRLEKVIYFQDYVVIDPGDTPLKTDAAADRGRVPRRPREIRRAFRAGMGAEAIRELLGDWTSTIVAEELREELAKTRSKQKIKDLSKRLRIVEALRQRTTTPPG